MRASSAPHRLFRKREAFGQGDEVTLAVRQLRIEDDVGKQGFDDRLAAAFEKRLAGGAVGSIPGGRMFFAADPVDDGANVAVDQGGVLLSANRAR